MALKEAGFNPENYIEGQIVFDQEIKAIDPDSTVAQMRALLVIALKRQPEQLLVYFSKPVGSETEYHARVMTSDEKRADLHYYHVKLSREGFDPDFSLSETKETDPHKQASNINDEIETILEDKTHKMLIQYLKRHRDAGYSSENGYAITSIAG